jgi:nucleoprotein TPR
LAEKESELQQLQQIIIEKDAEIKTLKEALEKLPNQGGDSTESDKASRQALEQQLQTANDEKEAAVKTAVDNLEKKFKVQLTQRDIAQAKLVAVQKAVQETPEKPIKDVWEVASKARPVPKAATVAPNLTATSSSPATAPASANPPVPSSPSAAQSQPSPFQTSFAQSSKPVNAAPNPQAPTFNPNASVSSAPGATIPAASTNSQVRPNSNAPARPPSSGIPPPGGAPAGSKLPRIPTAPPSRQTSIGGPAGLQLAGGHAGLPSRGNFTASGIGRGGGIRGGGSMRGGRGAANAANAGQKRAHDGVEPGGNDSKRTRGGGPSGGA